MPGISGLVNSGGQIDNRDEILETFIDVHSLKGVSLIHKTFKSDHCVITNTLTGLLKATLEQPAIDATGNTVLFLEGEVFNTEELQRYLSGPRDVSPCSVLLALFLERGVDFVSLVDGEFNIVIYQKTEGRLVVLNDHLSSKPMFYAEQGNNLLFGSEKKSILAGIKGSPTIDPVGLLHVFAHGHNIGDRTFIQGLRCLPPASRLEFHQGRLSLTRDTLLTFRVPKSLSRISALTEEWCEHLQRATNKRLQGKERVLLSLSGGLDSRAIACAIPRDFRPISARTQGSLNSLEAIYATDIARRLGFSHFREDPTAVPLSEILAKVVWRTECAVAFVHCRTLAFHSVIKERADFVLSGPLGDVSSGSTLSPVLFLPRRRKQFIEMAYRRYVGDSESSLRELFNEKFLRDNFPRLKDDFLASFDRPEGETNIQLYEIWRLYTRQPRFSLSAAPVDTHLFEHIRPFLDRDYLSFVLTLPTRLRFGQVLYQAMIYQLGPEIRGVPNANTDLKLRRTVRGNMLNKGITLGQKGRSKLLRKVKPSFRNKIERSAPEDLARMTRQDSELRRIIEVFVHSNAFDSTIFNGPGILSMLDRHYRGTVDHADLLCSLATFAVGLRYFVYTRPRLCPVEAEPLT